MQGDGGGGTIYEAALVCWCVCVCETGKGAAVWTSVCVWGGGLYRLCERGGGSVWMWVRGVVVVVYGCVCEGWWWWCMDVRGVVYGLSLIHISEPTRRA